MVRTRLARRLNKRIFLLFNQLIIAGAGAADQKLFKKYPGLRRKNT